MKALILSIGLLALFASTSRLAGQQTQSTSDGTNVVRLTSGQESAVNQFLKLHPDMLQANCGTLGLPRQIAQRLSAIGQRS